MPYSHSFTSIIFGESAFPVREAGHTAWQRPQRVQASKSITCFQLNSWNWLMPKLSCSSIFSMGVIALGGASCLKNVFVLLENMWNHFVKGRKAIQKSVSEAWNDQMPICAPRIQLSLNPDQINDSA